MERWRPSGRLPAGELAWGGSAGFFEEFFRDEFRALLRGRRVGLLVADGTRSWNPNTLLTPLAELFEAAGSVRVFVCTGTHDPGLPETVALLDRLRAHRAGRDAGVEWVCHDGRLDPHRAVGETSRGTRVQVDERLAGCDVLLVLSDVKLHYFAGYSNPTKYVVPGLASVETARENHFLALDPASRAGHHPWHPDPWRRHNPLAEDLLEAYGQAVGDRPVLALVTVGGRVPTWGALGPVQEVSARAMRVADALTTVPVKPVRRLVLSAGGSPFDESLYTAQRALELAREAILPGGELLFLARCPNGIGPPSARENFLEPLRRPLASLGAPTRADYVLYGHKPVLLARLRERLDSLSLHSELPDELVRGIRLVPAQDPRAVVERWARAAGDPVAFLDDGAFLAPTLAQDPRP